eukprot:scaffold2179_cov312-Prasinococcus_capsulatus_cf.AAC.2
MYNPPPFLPRGGMRTTYSPHPACARLAVVEHLAVRHRAGVAHDGAADGIDPVLLLLRACGAVPPRKTPPQPERAQRAAPALGLRLRRDLEGVRPVDDVLRPLHREALADVDDAARLGHLRASRQGPRGRRTLSAPAPFMPGGRGGRQRGAAHRGDVVVLEPENLALLQHEEPPAPRLDHRACTPAQPERRDGPAAGHAH